jgi:hypothetical protein
VRFVEAFLRELRPKSLSALSGDTATGYFPRLSTSSKFTEWQFRQLAEAIQLLS